jgi:hypothetical protein
LDHQNTIETTDAPNVREMYRPLDTPQGAQLERCPICEAEAGLWQFSEKPDAVVQRVVMCSHGDEIGPQDGIANSGCLMYMPDEAFYQPTAREAIRYWNGFAVALRALRAENQPARAAVAAMPLGRWQVDQWSAGRVAIQAHGFGNDLALVLNGDYPSLECKLADAQRICDHLNTAAPEAA